MTKFTGMTVSKIIALAFFVVLVFNSHADEEEDSASKSLSESEQELQTKESIVREAKAKFDEAQRKFDAAAAELQKVRSQFIKESSDLTRAADSLDEVVFITSKFTERMAPLTLSIAREGTSWNYWLNNDGVIGVLLGKAADDGVLVEGVMETAPAYIAGIEAGDVILRIDGVDMSDLEDPIESAVEVITSKQPGTIVRFTVQRADDEVEVDVATIDRVSMERLRADGGVWQAIEGVTIKNSPVDPRLWNYISTSVPVPDNKIFVMEIDEELGSYFDVDYGVLVIKARDVDGIQAGDILLEVDDKPVRSLSQAFQHKRDAGDNVEIRFKRNKREKNITLQSDQFSVHAILE